MSLTKSAAAGVTSGVAATSMQPQQVAPKATDQNNGDLHVLIMELTKAAALEAVSMEQLATTPVADVMDKLKTARPELFKTLEEKFIPAVREAAALSDTKALQMKDAGNKLFMEFQNKTASSSECCDATNQLDMAVLQYTKGLTMVETDEVTATLLNNRSTVLFAQRRFRDACLDANYALRLRPQYWKALQRRGACLEALGFPDLAKADAAAAEAGISASTSGSTNTSSSYDFQYDKIEEIIHATQNIPCDALAKQQKGSSSTSSKNPMADEAAPDVLSPPPTVRHIHPYLRIDREAVKGRLIAATRTVPAGSTILTESPYAMAPKAEAMFTSCALCLRRTPMLYPCAQYRKVAKCKSRGLFCSTQCAELHWSLYGHREHQNPFYLVCPLDSLLACRMLFTPHRSVNVLPGARSNTVPVGIASSTAEDATSLKTVGEKTVLAIDDKSDNTFGKKHIETLVAFSKEAFPALSEAGGNETACAVLALFLNVVRPGTEAEYFRKAQRQILANGFSVSCQDRVLAASDGHSNKGAAHNLMTVVVGKAMYSVAALFNHSCDPNCFVSFRGNPHGACGQLTIKALRTIQEGEELTITYQGLDKYKVHSTRGRIRALRASYGFNCTCSACFNEVDEPVTKELEEYYIKASDYYQKGRRLTREGKFEDAVNVLFQSYEIVMRYICPPPRPPQWMIPKTHDALAQAYLLKGDRTKCVEHLKASLSLQLQLNKHHHVAGVGQTDRDRPAATEATMAASYLCAPSEVLNIGGNVALIQEYTRLAFMLDSCEKEPNLREEAKQFAKKAAELLQLFYPPSTALAAELLQLELIGCSSAEAAAQ